MRRWQLIALAATLGILTSPGCTEGPEPARAEITASVHYDSLPAHLYEDRLDEIERHILKQLEPGDRYAFPEARGHDHLRSVEIHPRPMGAYREIRALRKIQQERAGGADLQPSQRHNLQMQPRSFTDRAGARCLYLVLDPDRRVPPNDSLAAEIPPTFIAFLLVPEDSVLGGPSVLAWKEWLRHSGARNVELLGLNDPVPECREAFSEAE